MVPALVLVGLMLPAVSHAETADALPDGSQVVYAGLGFNTFKRLQFGEFDGSEAQELDTALRTRLDMYWAMGLADRLQISAALPLVHSMVLDSDDRGPCPDLFEDEDYCKGFFRPGQLSVAGRYQLVRRKVSLAGDLSLRGDPWNGDLRGRYTAYGEGTVDLQPGATLDWDADLGGDWALRLVGAGAYTFRFSRLNDDGSAGSFRAPADHISGLAELQVMPPGPVSVTLGSAGMQRLWGLDWDAAYQEDYFPTQDRWTVLWYKQVAAYGKVSIDLPKDIGLHVGAGRVLRVRNGPPDMWDFTVGVHKYYGPKG